MPECAPSACGFSAEAMATLPAGTQRDVWRACAIAMVACVIDIQEVAAMCEADKAQIQSYGR